MVKWSPNYRPKEASHYVSVRQTLHGSKLFSLLCFRSFATTWFALLLTNSSIVFLFRYNLDLTREKDTKSLKKNSVGLRGKNNTVKIIMSHLNKIVTLFTSIAPNNWTLTTFTHMIKENSKLSWNSILQQSSHGQIYADMYIW